MYALVGLGNQSVRDRLAINHSKMLAYAGILATPGRAPEVICNLVSHCFDLPDVTIERWQLRKVAIDPAHQNRLGVRNPKGKTAGHIPGRSILGVNFTLGARVPDRSGKFLLQIGGLSRERYLSFLPDGENHLPLTMFLSFILRDQFAWDLRLCLAPQQAKGCALAIRPAPASAEPALLVSRKYRPPSQSESGNNSMEPLMAEEKQQSRQASLTLQVMNGNELESGRAAKCLFSENGGDIGHTPECHWQVQDRAGSIAARACTVIRHDGAYCLRCLTPGLMINLAPASSDALIRLRQGMRSSSAHWR